MDQKRTKLVFLMVPILLFGIIGLKTGESDPEWYKRQSTWEETVRLSRESLIRNGLNEKGENETSGEHQAKLNQLWTLVRRDFRTGIVSQDHQIADPDDIFTNNWILGDFKELAQRYASNCMSGIKDSAVKLASQADSPEDLARLREMYGKSKRCRELIANMKAVNLPAIKLAVSDMGETYPKEYDSTYHSKAVDLFQKRQADVLLTLESGREDAMKEAELLLLGIREALLANPLLDFDTLLVVRRDFNNGEARDASCNFTPESGHDYRAGLISSNFSSQANMRRTGFYNEIATLCGLRGTPKIESLYKSTRGELIRDMKLDFDGQHVLFSSPVKRGKNWQWAVHEMTVPGGNPVEITPSNYPDLHFYSPCYLPDGRIIVSSNANYVGIPCVGGGDLATAFYLLEPKTKKLRQLTFDQDHVNDPVVMNDGRVAYIRWEYSDIPHYFSRRLMSMNPDGTNQTALYGSNSWFPTAFRFPTPVPDHPSLMVGIIAGHHDYGEAGRLVLLDPGLARSYPFHHSPASKEWGPDGSHIVVIPDTLPPEKTGFVQYVPGYGKHVAATICDNIVNSVFLKETPELITHPYPLNSKYILVSMKPKADGLWGIYLVDVFDNVTLIAELEGSGFFEPIPFRPRKRPTIVSSRIKEDATTSSVFISDIYEGPGLKGVPRGTVKALRLFSYHYGYYGRAGINWVGTHGGWDIKRILGTVDVEEDGSAHFIIPANTPVSIQPLDEEGRAVQLMRSWLVGMPGERVSCVGCHEDRNQVTPIKSVSASRRAPESLKLWYGPARPFGFENEVYPVLQKYCIGCHNGENQVGPRSKPSFANADVAYKTLHPYVHRPGTEADMSILNPMEYHATTSPLVQILTKGHYGVRLEQLDRESRDRLYTWIDLNVPQFAEFERGKPIIVSGNINSVERRRELAREFAGIVIDAEMEAKALAIPAALVTYIAPPAEKPIRADELVCKGFPMNRSVAEASQKAGTSEITKTVSLDNEVKMVLKRIPSGSFIMGSLEGHSDERPRTKVRIEQDFWMTETEITNAQYACFDPDHDTKYIDMHFMDRVTPGYIANHPDQPVARVSWQEAMRFCEWLSRKSGLKVSLPSEAQWEWAARSGTETRFFYGDFDSDWGQYANLADQSLRWFNTNNYPGPGNLQWRRAYPLNNNFPLRDERFKDQYFVVDYVGMTKPNAWGLKDMIGNVSEWTKSSYKPYPYSEADSRNDGNLQMPKVVRGGSWADRPADTGSSVRRPYESWQKVYDVGFRIIIEQP